LLAVGLVPAGTAASVTSQPVPVRTGRVAARVAPDLRVDGHQIVGPGGQPHQIGGVNRSGAEYACAQGWGIFDGPVDRASIKAIASWHANAVRVPLNESCWLGISGVSEELGGKNYRRAIDGFVHRIERQGLNVILDLHFAHHGDEVALDLQKMPNADHTPDFWRSVAKRYGDDRAIVLDLFNEPHDVGWDCWRDGCEIDGWQAVGMQRLVRVVRNAGAMNVILLGGIGWSGDLTQWAAHMPDDPLDQLAAGWHIYNFTGCTEPSCWADQLAGIDGRAPMIVGEFGQTDCAHWFVDPLMDWADERGIGYLAWTWDAWPSCDGPTLITDYDGTPTAYGIGVRTHYRHQFGP
jgi:hypothetical protein